jgi:hypothetical protein
LNRQQICWPASAYGQFADVRADRSILAAENPLQVRR